MAMPERIRIVVADGCSRVRKGLVISLQTFDDLEVVGEAASAPGVISLCAQIRPDVVLIDVALPGAEETPAIRAIRCQYPAVRVIGLASLGNESLAAAAFQAGVVNCLLKNITAAELVEAIRATDRR